MDEITLADIELLAKTKLDSLSHGQILLAELADLAIAALLADIDLRRIVSRRPVGDTSSRCGRGVRHSVVSEIINIQGSAAGKVRRSGGQISGRERAGRFAMWVSRDG